MPRRCRGFPPPASGGGTGWGLRPSVGGVADLFAGGGNQRLQYAGAEAVAEIAEALAGQPRGRKQREQRVERLGDLVQCQPVGDDLVEAGALEVAADEQRVMARHAPDDADVAG